ncbi:MAG: carbohydrate kinase family protein [Clostridiales bacterium]|jgi:fructokinase|nr:carbohydrate kinase family protein [Clostridiales bacterium]
MRGYEGVRKDGVLVVGDINVDLIVKFPAISPDGRVAYPDPELTGGGTCGNTLMALAKLGVPTAFMGTVGDDAYGRMLVDELRCAGVNTSALIMDADLNTVCVFAFVDERGERYLWGWPRERQSFQYLDRICWKSVENAGWIHSSGMLLTSDTSARRSVAEIFKRAKELGIPTSFDLNLRVDNGVLDEGYRRAVLDVLEWCDYALGSGPEEFYYLSEHDDWRECARSFARGDRTVIARMGADGSVAMTPRAEYEEKPFDVPVTDTVGAGDVFNAGFIAARLQGRDLRDCLIWGNGVSGYKVSRKGGRATPTAEQLSEFIRGASRRQCVK